MIPKVMALDVGDARVGVALSDALGMFAHPHSTVERKKEHPALETIVQLAIDEQVQTIVVGLPQQLDGSVGPQGEKVLAFVKKLQDKLSACAGTNSPEVRLWDERFTSVQAERILAGSSSKSNLKNKERSRALDQISACLILESFLSSRQSSR